MRANYHTHSTFCDGNADPETMTLAAIDAGYDIIGFSSHAPLPFSGYSTLKQERLEDYCNAVREAGARHSDRIEVLLGLEIDYIPGVIDPANPTFKTTALDFRLGSVHFLVVDDKEAFSIDGPRDRFEANLELHYGGDARRLVADYYRAVAAMVQRGGFDLIGHLDLVRKNNSGGRYFDETASWYRDAVMIAVESIASSTIVVEVNTGGVARGKTNTPYPEAWILRELRSRNVQVTICADAHKPEHLRGYYEQAQDHIKAAGYSEIAILSRGRWTQERIV